MTDRKLTLSPRLMMAAEMIRPGIRVADIGTDHGYLPAWLLINGKCESAVASDLREKPLENAGETLARYELENKIKLILSDGLKRIPPDEIDDIVLAGMGGDLIRDILSEASWLLDKRYRIICQPQSHHERVRSFFMDNGFEILRENSCVDAGKNYIALCAEYTGKSVQYPFGYAYYGKLPQCDSEYAGEFMCHQLNRFKKRAAGLLKSGQNPSEAEYLLKLSETFEKLLKERKHD